MTSLLFLWDDLKSVRHDLAELVMNEEAHVESSPLTECVNDANIVTECWKLLSHSDHHSQKSACAKEVYGWVCSGSELVSGWIKNSNYEEDVCNFSNSEEHGNSAVSVRVIEDIEETNARSKDDGHYCEN